MFEIGVKILTRQELLDPAGTTVQRNIANEFPELKQVRIGKYILLKITAKDKEEALLKAKILAKEILANPISEDYELELRNS